jgi:hypothetical protein
MPEAAAASLDSTSSAELVAAMCVFTTAATSFTAACWSRRIPVEALDIVTMPRTRPRAVRKESPAAAAESMAGEEAT